MRITSTYFARYAAIDMNRSERGIGDLQAQISSGKRILRPSQGPTDAAQISFLSDATKRIEQHQNNATMAEQALRTEEEVLTGVTSTLQRLRELVLGAKSGVQTAGSRQAYGAEAEQLLSQLESFANTRGPEGNYLFAGHKGQTQPFVRVAGAMTYAGDQGQPLITVGESRQVAGVDSGDALFMRVMDGNGHFAVGVNAANTGSGQIFNGGVRDRSLLTGADYTIRFTSPMTFDVIDDTHGVTVSTNNAFQSGSAVTFDGLQVSLTGAPAAGDEFKVTASRPMHLFSAAERFIAAMQQSPQTPAEQTLHSQGLNLVLNDIDQALDHVQRYISNVGARRKFIEDTRGENESVNLLLQRARSDIQDTDYAEAISKLETQMFTLDAIRQSYARIEGKSLFDFLR